MEISDIYQGRTVSGILRRIREKWRVYDHERLSIYSLTEEQKKFFFVRIVGAGPELSYANVPMLLQLPADTDLSALKSQLEVVIDNHPYLKVRFTENPDPRAEERDKDGARRDDTIPAAVALVQGKPLDRDSLIRPYNLLGKENLYRAALYDTENEGKFLFMDFHHVLIDEASFGIMVSDLKAQPRDK